MRAIKWVGAGSAVVIVLAACYALACGNEGEGCLEESEAEAEGPEVATAEDDPRAEEPGQREEAEEPSPRASAPEPEPAPGPEEEAREVAEPVGETEVAEPEGETEVAEPVGGTLRLGAELIATEGLHLERLVMSREVEDREPVDAATSFATSEVERIYAYMEFDNPDRQAGEVSVAWAPADAPDEERSRVTVNVGPHPRWRTWAYTSLLTQPGRYVAVVRDADDRVIARSVFEVTE